jgi:hypothetical protein
MIADLFIGIISLLAKMLHGILSAIPLSVPAQIQDSMSYFAGYLAYAGGIIDIPGVFTAFIFLVNFLIAWFTFKLILWAYHLIFARRVHEKQALPAQQK